MQEAFDLTGSHTRSAMTSLHLGQGHFFSSAQERDLQKVTHGLRPEREVAFFSHALRPRSDNRKTWQQKKSCGEGGGVAEQKEEGKHPKISYISILPKKDKEQ